MGTSQDLVPTGQAQGKRQETVQAMQAAGVPTSSGGGPPQPGPSGATPAANASPPPIQQAPPVDRAGLAQFDALANREPTENFAATPQRQVMFEQVRQSPNQVMQSIFDRMQGYKEG